MFAEITKLQLCIHFVNGNKGVCVFLLAWSVFMNLISTTHEDPLISFGTSIFWNKSHKSLCSYLKSTNKSSSSADLKMCLYRLAVIKVLSLDSILNKQPKCAQSTELNKL